MQIFRKNPGGISRKKKWRNFGSNPCKNCQSYIHDISGSSSNGASDETFRGVSKVIPEAYVRLIPCKTFRRIRRLSWEEFCRNSWRNFRKNPWSNFEKYSENPPEEFQKIFVEFSKAIPGEICR